MDSINIGKRIHEARVAKGMTLQDIADKIGVAKSTIQRYENGVIETVKLPVIEAISRALEVNAAWLLGKTEDTTFVNQTVTGALASLMGLDPVADAAYFRFSAKAKEQGIPPEDIELALDFLARAKARGSNDERKRQSSDS